MKVSTPLGDYPYEVVKVGFRDGRILVTGRMGEWETTMQVEPSDWAPPLALAGVTGLALLALGAFARGRRR
ncbi:MAG TPA: hypothetical protein VF752_01235 [Thermoleophilaceae bacterium]